MFDRTMASQTVKEIRAFGREALAFKEVASPSPFDGQWMACARKAEAIMALKQTLRIKCEELKHELAG